MLKRDTYVEPHKSLEGDGPEGPQNGNQKLPCKSKLNLPNARCRRIPSSLQNNHSRDIGHKISSVRPDTSGSLRCICDH